MGYLAGTLANVIPLPGGLGGVEGAMIGAFLAFGVDPGLAVAAVLGFRALEYWLPIVPGLLAYVRLLHGPGVGRQRNHAKHVMTDHLLRRENSRVSENTCRSRLRAPADDSLRRQS
jgi:hypothetical protein